MSVSIATLGMFGGMGGDPLAFPGGGGVPVDIRREEHAVKPLITVKNVRYSEEHIHEVNMSIISIKSFE